jgi:hypothetical protein
MPGVSEGGVTAGEEAAAGTVASIAATAATTKILLLRGTVTA